MPEQEPEPLLVTEEDLAADAPAAKSAGVQPAACELGWGFRVSGYILGL